MAELDAELMERVARWCAEAGRQTGAAEIRDALAPLGWDELLTVRALLADPPPARPLGPHALADLARGVPPDAAAEREREGRYHRIAEAAPEEAGMAEARPASPRRKGAQRSKAPEIVVRRARDRAAEVPAQPAPLPLLDELQLPGGRAVLERLVREHGGRRAVIARVLDGGWRRADGAGVDEEDVAALFDLHGLARPFARRERDELLHALRASGGVLARAAERVGLDAPGLVAALARLGVEREAERVRDERRAELRGRATLSDRVHLVLEEAARLMDLGLLAELEADLRARLPEHVRALRTGTGPLAAAFAASLSLDAAATAALAARFGLELGPVAAAGERPRRSGGPRAGGRSAGGRTGAAGPRSGGRRDMRSGPRGARNDRRERPAARRPGSAPGDARSGARVAPPGSDRDTWAGPGGARPGPRGPRGVRSGPPRGVPGAPAGGARPAFSRSRSTEGAPAARPTGTRGSGTWRGGPRGPAPTGARPAGPPRPAGQRGASRPGGRPGPSRPGGRPPPRGRGPRKP